MFGKSNFLDHEPSAMIHADSVSFLISTDDRIQKYSWLFLDKSIGEYTVFTNGGHAGKYWCQVMKARR